MKFWSRKLTMFNLNFVFRWRGENVSTLEVEATISNVLELKDATAYGVEIPNVESRAGMVTILIQVHVERHMIQRLLKCVVFVESQLLLSPASLI